MNPNAENAIGSARLWRASSGVAPEVSSHTILGLSRARNFVRRGFRRDAENHTPEARAPQNGPPFPPPTSEFGMIRTSSPRPSPPLGAEEREMPPERCAQLLLASRLPLDATRNTHHAPPFTHHASRLTHPVPAP